MATTMMELVWLDAADDHRGPAFTALLTRYWQEAIRGERAIPAGEVAAEAAHAATNVRLHRVLALEDGKPVGAASLVVDGLRSENAWLKFLFVAPEHRRRGIGAELLAAVRERARAAGRPWIRTATTEGHAAGGRFAERAGGRRDLDVEQSRCPVDALDVSQLRRWVDRAAERAAGYSLVAFDGVCPDEYLDAFTAVIPVMNTAPRSERTEEVTPTRDQVRESMAAHVRQGNESWTICARDDASGAFVGFTELSFSSLRPWRAVQGDTGVGPAHRQRGIGRWMKGQNALRLLAEHPEVEYIETWNASANEAMLSINRAMGFAVVARWHQWDVPA